MNRDSKNIEINIIIAILVALLFFILSFVDKKLIINPYTVSVSLAIILGMFIYFVMKSSRDTRSDLSNQKIISKKFEKKFNSFQIELEEKFKIYDRLHKLEVNIYGKKRSA